MIVRNEAAVLGRCLESVRDLIDSWVIVDTGSTDGTQDLVRSALRGIPGRLHERPWRDFGHNRTELMTLARGAADYLLLLDADMTLNRKGRLPELGLDGYLVAYEGPLAYAVPRLVRGDLDWRYVGATHEYLAADGDLRMAALPVLTVTHHADGGSRGDKLTRDLRLLERQLAAQPDDPRTVFYLAQTCRELGDLTRAESLYRKRVLLGGWDEEVFYARFRHALLVAGRDWPLGRELLADTWESRPSRIEPLYEMAVGARTRGDFAGAGWATELGLGSPPPTDLLFVHRWVYEWGMRLERSVACAHLGLLDEASRITDELLAEPDLPDDVTEALVANRAWLDTPGNGAHAPGAPARRERAVPKLGELCGPSTELPLEVAGPPGWPQMNPSIAGEPGGTGFWAIVRSVNYMLRDGVYSVADPEQVVRTRNVLTRFDDSLACESAVMLADPTDVVTYPTGIAGFEDCRLFSWRDRWWAVATSRDVEPDARAVQVLLEVDGDRLRFVTVLEGPDPNRHEKNWMPFVVGGELHFVYSSRPFTVLRFDEASRRLETVVSLPTDYRFTGLRGGSQGLPVDEGFLFVAHQVTSPGPSRRYLHRFVAVDGSLLPSGISPPFVFGHEGVEFCAGIAHKGDDLVMSYGVDDERAALAIVALSSVIEAIEPLRG